MKKKKCIVMDWDKNNFNYWLKENATFEYEYEFAHEILSRYRWCSIEYFIISDFPFWMRRDDAIKSLELIILPCMAAKWDQKHKEEIFRILQLLKKIEWNPIVTMTHDYPRYKDWNVYTC